MGIMSIVYCAIFVLVFVFVTLFCIYIFDKWWVKIEYDKTNEFTGIVFGAISLVFSLIIAFVIVTVWQDYEALNQTIEQESDKLGNIIAHSSSLPDSLKTPIYTAVDEYCAATIKEWETPLNTNKDASAIPALRKILTEKEPQGRLQEKVFDMLEDDLSNISNLKRERLGHVRSHVPTLVWLMLLVGSVIMLLFSFFIDTSSKKLKQIGVSFLAAMIAMSLYLVYTLNKPFSGTMQVSKEPYQKVRFLLEKNLVKK